MSKQRRRPVMRLALLVGALPLMGAVDMFHQAEGLSSRGGAAEPLKPLAADPALSTPADASDQPTILRKFEIELPLSGYRVVGSQTPVRVAVDSRGDLRSFGDLCQVIISLGDDPDTGVALPLRDLLPSNDPEAFHASLPTFYDGRPECSAEVCYKPSLLPGSRSIHARLECAEPSASGNTSTPHSVVASHSVSIDVSPRKPDVTSDEQLALLPFFREGSMEPLPMRVDWRRGDEEQAREFCEGAGAGEGLGACVAMVAKAVTGCKRERHFLYAADLLGHLDAAGVNMGLLDGTTQTYAEKMEAMIRVVSQGHVRRVCEIGFNAGHSALLWLLYGHPDLTVTSFDLRQYAYPPYAVEWLLKRFGPRLEVVMGTSVETVPAYAAMHPDVACDVLFIDGGHSGEIPMQDMINMIALANRTHHVLILDDTEWPDIRRGMETLVADGRMEIYEEAWSQSKRTLVQVDGSETDPRWVVLWRYDFFSGLGIGRYVFNSAEGT